MKEPFLSISSDRKNHLPYLFFLALFLGFFPGLKAQKDAAGQLQNSFSSKSSDDQALLLSFQGSLELTKMHETIPGAPPGYYPSAYSTKVGFNVGAFATKPILDLGPGDLAAMAGLEFIEKGAKYDVSPVTETIGLNYIELPIDAIYELQVSDLGKAFAGFGPYFGEGVGGKDKYNDGNSSTTNNSFGGNGANKFDFGIQVIGGFRLWNKACLSLSYDFGLTNIRAKNNTDYAHDKNGAFGINISYCMPL
jgi:hypothetical protein